MNRYETNMKRIFDHQSQDYYFRLYQNNFTYIIRPKERLEIFFDDKQVISCCHQIRLATCFELIDVCKEMKMGECLVCKFCGNFLLTFKNETSKGKLSRDVINLFVFYPREFLFLHFFIFRGT